MARSDFNSVDIHLRSEPSIPLKTCPFFSIEILNFSVERFETVTCVKSLEYLEAAFVEDLARAGIVVLDVANNIGTLTKSFQGED